VKVGSRQRLTLVIALGFALLACAAWTSSSFAATFTPVQTLTAPDNADNEFGDSIATDGNTMVVGAPYDTDGTGRTEGAAFAYTQTSPGTWSAPQTLVGDPDAARAEMFGSAVAIDGNTMVIGAPNAGNDTGAAYVFTRSGSGADWTQSQTLVDSSSSDGSYFGSAVAIDGNTIVVGAYVEDQPADSGDDYGAAYVFTQPSPGVGFGDSTELLSPEEEVGDQFGYAVAVSGQTVFVGAKNEMVSSSSAEGSVYAYTEASADDDWATGVTETTLRPPTTDQEQQFGASLAAQGSTLVVGDESVADGAAPNVGAALVYTLPADGDVAGAAEDAELQPSTAGTIEPFWGAAVAIDGPTIVVGSGQGNSITNDDPYVFTEPSGGWSSSATATQLPVTPDAGGVAVSGTTVVIGQPGEGDGDVVSFSQPATNVSVGLTPPSITADGSSTSVATATVTGASSDPASAENVVFTASDPNVEIGTVTNNGDGTYSAVLTSSTTAGAVTITATDTSATPNVVGQATLTLTSPSGGSGGNPGGGSGGSGSGSGGSGGGSGGAGGGSSGGGGGTGGAGSSGGSSGTGSGTGGTGGAGGSGPSGTGSGPSGSPAPVPPTSAQLRASLSAVLTPTGKDATLKAILGADGFVFGYDALEAGKLVIDWYQVPAGAHFTAATKKAPKPILIADVVKSSTAGKLAIKVKLTGAGKRLCESSRKLKLTAKVSFTPTGERPTISREKTFTLK
jgi:Invasin, domain 3/FG-GAP repeat